MATMTDLKKALAPLAEQKNKIAKSKRFEIDTEKVAQVLLTEPGEMIAKGDDDEDADDLVAGLTKRVSSIQALLEKAEEDKDGCTFVTTDENDATAIEFEVEKAEDDEDDDDGEEDGEITKRRRSKTRKRDDADADADPENEGAWPADLAETSPSRVRKQTSRERVVSTDPSKRRQVRKRAQDSERERRQDKRDRMRMRAKRHTE